MALKVTLIPGYEFSPNERIDRTKLNKLGRPTIGLQGSIAAAAIPPGSITGDKLSPSMISDLTPALPEGTDLVMFQDMSAQGLRQCMISQMLDLMVPHLPVISQVTLDESAWVIQAGGNFQATIRDFLREAVNGQAELAGPPQIDVGADTMLLWDASAPLNTNRNRKATPQNVVWSVTRTLIADTGLMTDPVDGAADEILIRDASQPAGAQQRRMPIGTFLGSTVRSWVRFDGTLAQTLVLCTFSAAADDITTAAAHNLNPGDYVWFDRNNSGNGVTVSTAYFVFPTTTTKFQLYRTRAGALAQDPAQRVDLTGNSANQRYSRWPSNPITAGANVDAIIRSTAADNNSKGQFRIYFSTPLPDGDYGIFANPCDTTNFSNSVVAIPFSSVPPTATDFNLICRDEVGNLQNAQIISVMIMR